MGNRFRCGSDGAALISPHRRAAVLCAAGYLAWQLHLYDSGSGPLNARELLLESLALWKCVRRTGSEASQRLDAARGMTWAYNHLGNVAHNRKEDAEAAHWCRKCLRSCAPLFFDRPAQQTMSD